MHGEASNTNTPAFLENINFLDQFFPIVVSPEFEQEPSPPMEWKLRGREG